MTAPIRRGRAAPVTLALATLVLWTFAPAPTASAAPKDKINCAFRVTVKDTDEWVDKPKGEEYKVGTAVLVEAEVANDAGLSEKRRFLVTAYHVVFGGTVAEFQARDSFSLPLGSGAYIQKRFYYNPVADLAIFELGEEGNRRVDASRLISPVSLLLADEPVAGAAGVPIAADAEPDTDPSIGRPAVAIGNPLIINYRALNIIYSCTVSEIATASRRVVSIISRDLPDDVYTAADKKRLLFLETLSIDRGFSGGPILVQVPGSSEPKLAGIILGGHPQVIAGRFAFACSAADVAHGIKVLTRKVEPSGTYEAADDFRENFWRDKRIVYNWGSTFSFSSSAVLESKIPLVNYRWPDVDNGTRPGTKGAKVSEKKGHIEYLFDGVTFQDVDFSGRDLTNFHFLSCTFSGRDNPAAARRGMSFHGAVLNGAIFENCTFELEQEPDDGVLRVYGRPLMAYGVQFRTPRVRPPTQSAEPGRPATPIPVAPGDYGGGKLDKFELSVPPVPMPIELIPPPPAPAPAPAAGADATPAAGIRPAATAPSGRVTNSRFANILRFPSCFDD
jgi:hypothetical protein